uniref:Polyprotein 2 n=1 Tax=Tomato fern seco-like virus TaxID=2933189 RepID=A0A9C7GWQ2_9SECO|nr:polyprotein 2 [Tomato fern seco-like virus]CAI5384008.1 polyprotein 2 [Tomato fern seco-like virus]
MVECWSGCPAKAPISKTALRKLIADGYDVDREGRCRKCQSFVPTLAPVESPPPKSAGPLLRAQRVVTNTRLVLPYKKQTCNVVAQVGPLEFVYAPLVDATPSVAFGVPASTPVEQEAPRIPLGLAPKWMVPVVAKPPAPRVPLTQRQEFALLKRRLILCGKAINRSQRRERIDRAYRQRCAQAAIRAAYDAAVQHVQRVATRMGQREVLRDLMYEPELTPAQEALVALSCQKAREDQACREAWLICVKAHKRLACPRTPFDGEVEVQRVVPECTTPWAHLGLHLTSLRSRGVSDGTMGAINFARWNLWFHKWVAQAAQATCVGGSTPDAAPVCANIVTENTVTPETGDAVSPEGYLGGECPGADVAPIDTSVVVDSSMTTPGLDANLSPVDDGNMLPSFVGTLLSAIALVVAVQRTTHSVENVKNTPSEEDDRLLSFDREIAMHLALSDFDGGFASLQKIACHVQLYQWECHVRTVDCIAAISDDPTASYCMDALEDEQQNMFCYPKCSSGWEYHRQRALIFERYLLPYYDQYGVARDSSLVDEESDTESIWEEVDYDSLDLDGVDWVDGNLPVSPIAESELKPEATLSSVLVETSAIQVVAAPKVEPPPPPPMVDIAVWDAQRSVTIAPPVMVRARRGGCVDTSWVGSYQGAYIQHCMRLNADRLRNPECKMERFNCGRRRKPEFAKLKAQDCTFGQEFVYVQKQGGGPFQKVDKETIEIECQLWYTAACALASEERIYERKCGTAEIEKVPLELPLESGGLKVDERTLSPSHVCDGVNGEVPRLPYSGGDCWMCKMGVSSRGMPMGDKWFEVPDPKPSHGMRDAPEHRLFCYAYHDECRLSSLTEDIQDCLVAADIDLAWLSRAPSFSSHLHIHYFGPEECAVDRNKYYPLRRSVDTSVVLAGSTLGIECKTTMRVMPVFQREPTIIGDFNVFRKLARFVGVSTCNSGHYEVSELQERMNDVHEENGLQTIDSLVKTLQKRKAIVKDAGENRVADKKQLTERDVFHGPKIINRLGRKDEKTFTAANLNSDQVVVCMQPKGMPTFTPLPRMQEEQARKLLEKDIGSVSSIALDLGLQSHIPQGLPVAAFMAIVDTRFADPRYATLCGAFVDLGRDRAKMLCLPLANFPLHKAVDDHDDTLNNLCLATYFNDPTSFDIGKAALQYGTLEFQEYKPSAYSDYTRVRDTWDQIARQQNTPRDRVLAGFSTFNSVSQDYAEELPEFGEIVMRCPPPKKPPVLYMGELGKGKVQSTQRTFTMPSIKYGGGTGRYAKELPVADRGATLKQDGLEYTPARYATCDANLVDTEIACVIEGTCPADVRSGQVLKRVQFREATYLHNNAAVMEWISAGLVSPTIRLRLTTGSNPFVGITLGVCLDYYNRCSTSIVGDKLPSAVTNALPNVVFPISRGSEATAELDVRRELGHGLFASVDSFEQPFLVVYVVGDNALPAADVWRFTLELLFSRFESSGIALEPLVTLPHTFSGILPLGVWRGPHDFNLGVNQPSLMRLKLDFATRRTFGNGTYSCLSFPAAYASWIQGHAGHLVGEVVHIGTQAVSCGLHLCVTWSQSVTLLRDALKIPGVRLNGGSGRFRLPLFSPFERVSLVDPVAELCLFAIGGPIATAGISASFQYMVRFDAIEGDESVPRVIGGTDSFAWANLSKFRAGFEFDFSIPARLCDIVRDDCEVKMCDNPLASLVASCGIMSGDMTVTVMWGTEKGKGALSGCVKVTTCFGRTDIADHTQVLSTKVAHLGIDTSISVDVPVRNFSGYTGSGATPYIKGVYLLVAISDRRVLTEIDVTVRLHPGFRFFGRSVAFPKNPHHAEADVVVEAV